MIIDRLTAELFTDKVRVIPDYPKPGINFVDVSSITASPSLFEAAVDCLRDAILELPADITLVGVDSRGFIFAGALAYYDCLGLVLARKKGKLPAETVSQSYTLEYGTAELEMNKIDLVPKRKYVIVDDIVATGGTVGAVEKMITAAGGEVLRVIALYQIKDCMDKLKENVKAPVYTIAEV